MAKNTTNDHRTHRRNVACCIVALNAATHLALVNKYYQLPQTTGSQDTLRFETLLPPRQRGLCDSLQELSDVSFESKVSDIVNSLNDQGLDSLLNHVSTTEYYESLLHNCHIMYRSSLDQSAIIVKAASLTIPSRFDFCTTYQEYVGVAIEEELQNRNRLRWALEHADRLVSLVQAAMKDGALDATTLSNLKARLTALHTHFPDAYEAIHGTRQGLFDPDAKTWWYATHS